MIPFLVALALTAAPLSAAAQAVTSAIEAPGPHGRLRGTLTGDGGPVVLIIPGSGPTDWDGNNPLGVKATPYRLLAEALAQRSIASVRIDKRGLYASAGAIADPNAVTIDDYITDTRAWIEAIRKRTGAACVWLLGHSEGGLIALAAGPAKADDLCGLALVSTAGRPMGDVLMSQLKANPANAPLLPAAEQAVGKLSSGARVDPAALPAPLRPLFAAEVQGFLISAFALDPAKLIAAVGKPILILQGGARHPGQRRRRQAPRRCAAPRPADAAS